MRLGLRILLLKTSLEDIFLIYLQNAIIIRNFETITLYNTIIVTLL